MAVQKMLERVEDSLARWFRKNEQKTIDVSKQLWDLAEIKFEEYESVKLLSGWLEAEGFTIERGVADMPTAYVATFTNGKGPVIGINSEYDALPGLGNELTDHLAPTGQNGHGCGHNLLGAGCTAAVVAIKNAMVELGIPGTIKSFGCPAEEGGSAKVFMVRDGVYDGVDAMVGWHPANATITSLANCLAVYSIRYKFHGKTAHAGVNPHLGRSALDAALLMDVGVNYLREHIPSTHRIHSIISQGGVAPNIVPDEAEIWYYLRAPQRHEIDELLERVNKIAQGMAMATETTVDIRITSGSSNSIRNKTLTLLLRKHLEKIGPPQFTPEEHAFAARINKDVTRSQKLESMRMMYGITGPDATVDLYEGISPDLQEGMIVPYSGDAADIGWLLPTAGFNVACQSVGSSNHSWQQVVCSGMGIGQKGMLVASRVVSMAALNLLIDQELLAEAQAEQRAQVADYPYVSPLPEGLVPGAD